MFDPETYRQRRADLLARVDSGLIVLLGNDEVGMNFAANVYPFRQDSSFLYYAGVDEPGLVLLVDTDSGEVCLAGAEVSVEQAVWTGPRASLAERAAAAGIDRVIRRDQVPDRLAQALRQGRRLHTLPPYRAGHTIAWRALSNDGPPVSETLIRAVVAQRSVKTAVEVEQIEQALAVTGHLFTTAMELTEAGRIEREVAGYLTGMALSEGRTLAFPMIFSVRGEILHNPWTDGLMRPGQMAVLDAGVESPEHYASDLTRTIPVSGRFDTRQRELYEVVLRAQEQAVALLRPGVAFRDVHLKAAETLLEGLASVGLAQGDPAEAAAAGAHTLFFPCGVGHQMGLDVHDMEALGEDLVGYDDQVQRDDRFGWRSLRLGRAVQPGFVVTVEPGLYFIDALIDQWAAERRCEAFIRYDVLERYRGFGGIRIEDDYLVTDTGARCLGRPLAKTVAEVEAVCSRL